MNVDTCLVQMLWFRANDNQVDDEAPVNLGRLLRDGEISPLCHRLKIFSTE